MAKNIKKCYFCDNEENVSRCLLNKEVGKVKYNIIYSCIECKLLKDLLGYKKLKEYIKNIQKRNSSFIFDFIVR